MNVPPTLQLAVDIFLVVAPSSALTVIVDPVLGVIALLFGAGVILAARRSARKR